MKKIINIAFQSFYLSFSYSTQPKTAILIHGYHLKASGWENVIWGDEKNKNLGRLPHAVKIAAHENPSVVLFGSGASKDGEKFEGQVIYEYLLSRWNDLKMFEKAFEKVDLESVKEVITSSKLIMTEPLNTKQEIICAGKIFEKQDIERVFLISSPTHCPRCLRDACVEWKSKFTIFCSPCETSFAGNDPSQVAIVEPPHRGDDDGANGELYPFYKSVNGLLS
eukprot:CAMPEP_0171454576 /NCGR_PEP_ID=MMETSP0945-20130129/1799_1 /TAXON_ID=109269 /ORGANISM="Vaucheria litorea, Strain CCMP2940" /LENGTH=222 /DNA_ID=CAMNT_0011979611 /DNA_START=38 /DNA_END=703 /DNA_ORIENTATION=+